MNLTTGVGAFGEAEGDTYASVEIVNGTFFADRLVGNAASNGLSGGGGNDVIDGRGGNDTLFGSTGVDTFLFQAGHGNDRVLDFTDGADRLDYSGHAGVSAFADLTVFQSGTSTIVQDGAGGQVVLQNVDVVDVTAADFDF